MVVFDTAWYAEMIERFSPESKTVSEALDNHSRCMLAAASIISTAIDCFAQAQKDIAKRQATTKQAKPNSGG